MKRLNQFSKLLLVTALIFAGCEGQEQSLIDDRLEDNPPLSAPEVTGTQGSADLTKFIAIGNSLTAGYMDGALYNLGQQNSLPALMAQKFQIAVEGDGDTFDGFVQPAINSETGYNTSVTQPEGGPVLGRFKLDTSIPGPSPVVNGQAITAYTGPDVHNFGVPGIQIGQLLISETGGTDPQHPAFNPFYQRFASDPGSSTILGEAIASQPTFFSLWIGNNDVLGYAASGASNPAILTSNGDFDTRINVTIGQLMGNTSADGIVANIPPLLGVPLFQAVRWNNITLDQATADQLSAGLEGVNGAMLALTQEPFNHDSADIAQRLISYEAGNNPILVIDEELEDLGPKFDQMEGAGAISAQQRAGLVPYEQSRPLTAGELVLISAGAVLGQEADGDNSEANTPIGVVIPLGFDMATGNLSGDRYYLSLAEQQEIEMSRAAFNASIEAAVNNYQDRLVLYNTNSPTGVFLDIFGISDGVPGITVSGVDLQPDFSPNGVVSTDGVHPNSRGNAIIANDMIKTIEAKFGAQIPKINVLNLPTVQTCSDAKECGSQQ